VKKVFWIKPIFFAAILLLSACKKEIPSGDPEWKPTHYPVVKTLYVTNVTSTTATLNGTVNGYGLPTTLTFEYDADTSAGKEDIQISYSNTVTASQSPVADTGLINVSADISGLNPCQGYKFRIKAENSLWENFYGEQQSFSTIYDPGYQPVLPPIPFNPDLTYGTVSDIDGNSYKTIQIGTQEWMAENLRTTRYADGTAIPQVTANNNWAALSVTDKAYSWYNWGYDCNSTLYGAYYTWAAAMNGATSSSSSPSGVQGVCPTGWHLPSDDEWKTLAYFLGGSNNAALKLKAITFWGGVFREGESDRGATNESGFTALPGGYCDGYFNYIGDACIMWSSTEDTWNCCDMVITRWLYFAHNFLTSQYSHKSVRIPVRCLKDDTFQGQAPTVITNSATNITSNGATLNATVNANGSPTTVIFEYQVALLPRGNPYWMGVTAVQSPVTGTSLTHVSADVTLSRINLGVAHPYRVIAINSGGIAFGNQMSFAIPYHP
jgi:uncharacterized protein (TIGR02145 family)